MSKNTCSRPPYITPEGAKALQDELDYLWRIKRPEVTQTVAEAAALGDRSENAEYIYGKKQLREIDRRVRYLRKRLEHIKVVDSLPEQRDKVYFGAWVTVEDEEGIQAHYRIVGTDESDASQGLISIDTPVARAMIGKTLFDEVDLVLPSGHKTITVIAIDYTESSSQMFEK
ncbi:transcription elongation factor GreB [Zooshikella harenae]|uniref:Transcription elongation factor GreB n=1 Tax=Zooshikella harenae TaxID=2827238 RepID=A0ABS5Z9M5_9GAMM|nr:transcription elongation factor GreB [Zooshikella harenae]MBU2710751.1 transcription elongation factor GreB [Zooshikella harenae]